MDEMDLKRFEELERKLEDNIATLSEEEEYDLLWGEMQREEEENMRNSFQFGY